MAASRQLGMITAANTERVTHYLAAETYYRIETVSSAERGSSTLLPQQQEFTNRCLDGTVIQVYPREVMVVSGHDSVGPPAHLSPNKLQI